MQPDTGLTACVGLPGCSLEGDAAHAAQDMGCRLCERWHFCGQSRQIVKLAQERL